MTRDKSGSRIYQSVNRRTMTIRITATQPRVSSRKCRLRFVATILMTRFNIWIAVAPEIRSTDTGTNDAENDIIWCFYVWTLHFYKAHLPSFCIDCFLHRDDLLPIAYLTIVYIFIELQPIPDLKLHHLIIFFSILLFKHFLNQIGHLDILSTFFSNQFFYEIRHLNIFFCFQNLTCT